MKSLLDFFSFRLSCICATATRPCNFYQNGLDLSDSKNIFFKFIAYIILNTCFIGNFMKNIVKTIYNLVPFKQEIFSILKIIWKPQEALYRHLYFKGVFTIKINQSKKFKINHYGFWIENELFWRGFGNSWEKESLKLWVKLCEESQVIFDIGANTGVYALVAKTINNNAKVYSFEPEPKYFDMLRKNIILNNFDIKSYRKAISDHNGEVIIDDYSEESKSLKVACVTIDEFVKQNDLKRIDLIKIDVETHEPEVLNGFSNYLSLFRPTLLIEILNKDIADKIYANVRELGYLYFNIDENGKIRQTDRIEKSDYYNYLLCNPDIAIKLGLIKNGL